MDRELSKIAVAVDSLILLRAEIVKGRVETTSIIKHFDVREKVSPGLVSGAVNDVMNTLAFQCAKEALHWGVVVPGSGTVHTNLDVVIRQQRLVGVAGVLAALIRVMDETRIGLSLLQRHPQRSQCQLVRHTFRHRPTDDAATVQVQDGRQMERKRIILEGALGGLS